MPDNLPLPSTLSGDVEERLIRLDKSLFYIVAGALSFIAERQRYEETGTLTEDETREALSQMLWDFYNLEAKIVQAGSVVQYAGATVPDGWLACDGSVVLRASYANLFTAIGTLYNTGGEPANAFRLPDMRGRLPLGVGAGAGLTSRALAAKGGTETHQLSVAEIPSHVHLLQYRTGSGSSPNAIGTSNTNTLNNSYNTEAAGGSGFHNNMQPWVALNFIIAT